MYLNYFNNKRIPIYKKIKKYFKYNIYIGLNYLYLLIYITKKYMYIYYKILIGYFYIIIYNYFKIYIYMKIINHFVKSKNLYFILYFNKK